MFQKKIENDLKPRMGSRLTDILVLTSRIILTPIFLIIRIYYWVWDFDYNQRF